MLNKPNFFIVGAPKAGTTALYSYLEVHPQVCMSTDKEPNYFSHKEIEQQKLYYKKININNEPQYLALFQCSENIIAKGEASVSYLFYPEVAKRIYNFNHDAKIIISLREPVSRAFSHYLMDYSLGLVTYPFDTIVSNGSAHPKTGIYFQQYILLSEYYGQVKRYIDLFPTNQVKIIFHDEFLSDEDNVLNSLYAFLGLDAEFKTIAFEKTNVTTIGRNKVIQKLYALTLLRKTMGVLFNAAFKKKIRSKLFSKDPLPVLSPSTKLLLQNRFHNDIIKLEELLNRDLSSWLKK